MKLTFFGGAESVTGANYMLESGGVKILVDCGLKQGGVFCEIDNFNPFSYNPEEISAVFVTHAHIDHTGRLPQLVKCGFKGRIYSTPPTRDFAEMLLLDSQHILRKEAERSKRETMYDESDVERMRSLWDGIPYRQSFSIGPFEITFINAGHVLGSASVVIKTEGKTIVFSGDLGNIPTPFIKGTEYIENVDYALIESVYGGRVHEGSDSREELIETTIKEVVRDKGVVIIPAFALERTQEMIYLMNNLVEQKRVSRIPVFIDSPLAIKLTAVYQKYSKNPMYFKDETISQIKGGDAIFNFPGLSLCLTRQESMAIASVLPPKIIIAGSGMSHGGRVIHHEKRYLSDPQNAILFVGYQAEGSLGRKILDGEKFVTILGENIPVLAKVKSIGGYSGHADQPQLLQWINAMKDTVKRVFVVQGESNEASELARKAKADLGVYTSVPKSGDVVEL